MFLVCNVEQRIQDGWFDGITADLSNIGSKH